ncbi:hypothetical protein RintRC_4855 [Richelia intracellularis]|nr:hypothetical protein RintRC_4855 [Richelia intracellularis]
MKNGNRHNEISGVSRVNREVIGMAFQKSLCGVKLLTQGGIAASHQDRAA